MSAPNSFRIVADLDTCLGSGVCTVYAPGTFTVDESARVTVIDPPGDSIDAIRTAVEACPTGALTLIED